MSAEMERILQATEGKSPSVAIYMQARGLSLIAREYGIDLGDGFHNLATAIGWKCHGTRSKKNGFIGEREARISENVLCDELGGKTPVSLRSLKRRLWLKYGITFTYKKGYHGKSTVYTLHTLEQWDALMRFNAACIDFWNANPNRHEDICNWLGVRKRSGSPEYPGAIAFAAGSAELDWHLDNASKGNNRLNGYLASFLELAYNAGFSLDGEIYPPSVSFEFRHLQNEGKAEASELTTMPSAHTLPSGREAPHPRSDYPAAQPNRGGDFTGATMQEPWPGFESLAVKAGFITEGETVPRPVSFEFRHLAAKDSGEREGTRAKASVPSEAPDAYRVTGGREAPHPRSDYPAAQPNRGGDFTGATMQEPWPGWEDSAYTANPF